MWRYYCFTSLRYKTKQSGVRLKLFVDRRFALNCSLPYQQQRQSEQRSCRLDVEFRFYQTKPFSYFQIIVSLFTTNLEDKFFRQDKDCVPNWYKYESFDLLCRGMACLCSFQACNTIQVFTLHHSTTPPLHHSTSIHEVSLPTEDWGREGSFAIYRACTELVWHIRF